MIPIPLVRVVLIVEGVTKNESIFRVLEAVELIEEKALLPLRCWDVIKLKSEFSSLGYVGIGNVFDI